VRRLWFWVLTTVGCNQIIGTDQLRDSTTCDGTVTHVCAHPLRGTLQLTLETIDTDTDPRCETVTQAAGNPPLCVLAAHEITVVGQVRAIGSRPLVLFATGSVLVQTGASIDVSSQRGGDAGAGASSGLCPQFARATSSAGGGAGGSFGGQGGDGGNGMGGTSAGLASQKLTVDQLGGIHGGCRGQDGSSTTGTAGLGGESGGALFLLAKTSVQIGTGATLLAGGAGGDGGGMLGGGGGGGAGGLIAIESPAVTIAGAILSHGGGGGGGGGNASMAINDGGGDGAATYADTVGRAQGGSVTALGGAGGKGSYRLDPGGTNGTGSTLAAGGGGGGAAGLIWVVGTLSAMPTMVTPALIPG
jgi:hypothetical protein